MFGYFTTLLAATASLASAAAIPGNGPRTVTVNPRGTAGITPHEQYSSSVGVLGCKINTNRVAYWPSSVGCDNICVKVSYGGRSLYLLKIDQSGGAYDISYDAWNQLAFGVSATVEPHQGGGISMTIEDVAASNCASMLDNGSGKVPLCAANSMNYVASCLNQPNSYVAKNYKLYNIMDPVCHWGKDEVCSLNLSVSNQPSCPSGLGNNSPLNLPVWNVQYGTGKLVAA
ncbi:Fc.00g031410.m01.CDS01 [Cosmosporella sp. VM-42]